METPSGPITMQAYQLELEWNIFGHSTGNYSCILYGESVAQRHLAA
jgi:hypothetical protein